MSDLKLQLIIEALNKTDKAFAEVRNEVNAIQKVLSGVGKTGEQAGGKTGQAFDKTSQKIKETGGAAKVIQKDLNAAGKSGKQAGAKTGQAFDKAGQQVRKTTQNIDKMATHSGAASKAVSGHMHGSTQKVGLFNSSIMNASMQLMMFGMVVQQVAQGLNMLLGFDAGMAWQRMENAMLAATGTARAAADGLAFVRAEAERLGLDLATAGQGFSQLSAAAKGTALSSADVREIFTGVAETATVLGMSAADTSGAIRALSQIMSKGTVQAEELRGQLGERIPGAFQIAARSMGVTTQALNKMLEQGQVISDVFLPKFAAQMRKEFGGALPEATQSLRAAVNRLQTAWFELQTGLSDAGGMTVAIESVGGLTEALKGLGGIIDDLSDKESSFQKTLGWLNRGATQILGLAGDALGRQLPELTPEELASLGLPQVSRNLKIEGADGYRDRSNIRELEIALQQNTYVQNPVGDVDPEKAKKLAILALDVEKLGLNKFDAKIADINAKAAELREKFGELAEIDVWRKAQIGAVETSKEMALLKGELKEIATDTDNALGAFQTFAQGLNLTDDAMTGITSGLTLYDEAMDDLGAKTGETFAEMSNAVTGWASEFSSELNDAFWSADFSFSRILESFGRMLTQMVIQKQIVEPLLSSGLKFLGNLFPGDAATAVVGGVTSSIDYSKFSLTKPKFHEGGMFVPKFHSGGLNADEGLAILKGGERVLTGEQNRTFDKLAALLTGGGAGSAGGTVIKQTIQVDARGSSVSSADLEQAVERGARQGYQAVYDDIEGRGPISRRIG